MRAASSGRFFIYERAAEIAKKHSAMTRMRSTLPGPVSSSMTSFGSSTAGKDAAAAANVYSASRPKMRGASRFALSVRRFSVAYMG